MMYSEFIQGTGCKDNEHNFEVFQNLEVMYMNSDMSKEEIYEYGKKLVDNSKSEAELRLEAEIKEEIQHCNHMIELYKSDIAWKEQCIKEWSDDKEWVKNLKAEVKNYKTQIKTQRNKIASLKWVLA